MATTRAFNSLGVVATDAQQVTEIGLRTKGEFYRRTSLTDIQQIAGELYDVNPRTEDLNQKLFNQSSFTDLLESKGSIGWTNLVDYEVGALVWGSDGTPGNGDYYICLRDNGPSTFIFDPITDNVANPQFWQIFENAQQLRLDLTDETPGDEGARRVGHNYTDVNDGVDEGLTVKTALDNAFLALIGIQGLDLLAFGNILTKSDRMTPPTFTSVSVQNSFNIVPGGIAVLPGLDGIGDPTDLAQGVRVTFTTPIPAAYNIQVYAQIGDDTVIIPQVGIGSYTSYDNALTTSIDVYHRFYPSQPSDAAFVRYITFSLVCYRYNP